MHKIRNIHILIILSVFYLVGITIHIIPSFRNLALNLTEPQLLIVNVSLLAWLVYNYRRAAFSFWLLGAFIFSVSLEIIGVKTGLIFGKYEYGDTMNLQLMNVPIVIGLNWIILILAGYNLAKHISSGVVAVLISGILVVLFDFVMEPVAMELDYWRWENQTIPVQNYVAWFLITIVLVSFLHVKKVFINNLILKGYFIIQFIFFLTLRLFIM